ncbi:hypothetical protein [Ornithinibacillus californiensis]|uniref:hypothetical protein n=1 Tax=Ornithinibacillus californiensis TaxID=161536 RepID=UPI00064D7D74|nr:hypothetical protein [Ornithinibacillus californiensis]
MKKPWIGIVIIIFYSIPFAYFSLYQDFTNRSLVGYLIMVLITAILAFFGQYFSSFIPLIIGNILSTLVSIYVYLELGNTEGLDEGYFKPFYPLQLIIVLSVLNLVPQFFAAFFAHVKKTKKVTGEK